MHNDLDVFVLCAVLGVNRDVSKKGQYTHRVYGVVASFRSSSLASDTLSAERYALVEPARYPSQDVLEII